MKWNSPVTLTLMLLALMAGAGLLSAAWGIALGREALKGITQPDTRPGNTQAKRQAPQRREEVSILREEDIIANVKARINGNARDAATKERSAAPTPVPTNRATQVVATNVVDRPGLPIVAESQNIVMQVSSVRRQADSVILQVSLRNNSSQPVRFLYSFLNVTDERGRALTASTDGLPAELPAASQAFSGTVTIPTALLDGVNQVSMTLADYPDQALELRLANIPVGK